MHLIKTKRASKPAERTTQEQEEIDQTLTLLTGKPYTNAAQTDITKTFRRLGWVVPSEARRGAKWLPTPTTK